MVCPNFQVARGWNVVAFSGMIVVIARKQQAGDDKK
jgi:hypothetical protein